MASSFTSNSNSNSNNSSTSTSSSTTSAPIIGKIDEVVANPYYGVDFKDARIILRNALSEAIMQSRQLHQAPYSRYFPSNVKCILYLIIPSIFCIIVYSIANQWIKATFSSGIIFTLTVLVISCVTNAFVLLRTDRSESMELSDEIDRILSKYDKVILNSDTYNGGSASTGTAGDPNIMKKEFTAVSLDSVSSTLNEEMATAVKASAAAGSKSLENVEIPSGHVHINIVTVFRNNKWQRLPLLLLVDGDIIALMTGDLTPGRVYEIDCQYNSSNIRVTAHQLGKMIDKGVKITCKDGGLQQQRRHHSISSVSTELLSLSGGVRCFCMAETPIKTFYSNVFAEGQMRLLHSRGGTETYFNFDNDINGDNSTSLSHGSRSNDGSSITKIGDESLIRSLLKSIAVEGMKALIVSVTVFVIAAILRFSILSASKYDWAQSFAIPLTTIVMSFIPLSIPFYWLIAESIVTGNILATTETILCDESYQSNSGNDKGRLDGIQVHKSGHTSKRKFSVSASSNLNASSIDNEDIESRTSKSYDEFQVEGGAETVSTKVLSALRLQYIVKTILTRLNLITSVATSHHGSTDTGTNNQHLLLPIPFARLKLLEVLGAVSMVCFVDDDIICEQFSVAEEVFLLKSNDKEGAKHGEISKGTVLDLHANPNATGCRFENPQWWNYLSSLKPVGLAAMLTFSPTVPFTSHVKSMHKSKSTSKIAAAVGGGGRELSKSPSERHVKRSLSIKPGSRSNYSSHATTAMEALLIDHVRKTMPLEALRELAEEIGFTVDDLAIFTRMLEMNVIAPGLSDARLLEDMHAWGQEETRRRGTLMSQVRSSVVRDSRSGGFQMMSQGDPSLLLNYCREYWDGLSISPLSSANRKEVLSIYNRWDLEDFDVVAFAYTPIPNSLQPAIITAYNESIQQQNQLSGMSVSADNSTSATGTNSSKKTQSNCIFIVDPVTYDDLEGISSKPVIAPTTSTATAAGDAFEDLKLGNAGHIDISLSHPDSGRCRSNSSSSRDTSTSILVKELAMADALHSTDRMSSTLSQHTANGSNTKFNRSISDSNLHLLSNTSNSATTADHSSASNEVGNEILFDMDIELETNDILNIDDDDELKRNYGILLDDSQAGTTVDLSEHDLMLLNRGINATIPMIKSVSFSDVQLQSSGAGSGGSTPSISKSADFGTLKLTSASLSPLIISSANRDSVESVGSVSNVNVQSSASSVAALITTPKTASLPSLAMPAPYTTTPIKKTKQSLLRASVKQAAHSSNSSTHRSIGASLWPLMRQQVFLGMAASSVPIKAEVPDIMEDLNRAGVRFVYFSPRNMRRSKPVAEKIGIQFDWNCAISLRDLNDDNEHDPHRYISQYADWDVHARLPHGIEAIKKHLIDVDNVPLLVSLYTDATPKTIHQMIQIYRGYGEVILTVGSSYRSHNQPIFAASDVPVSIAVLPGNQGPIPSSLKDVVDKFPHVSTNSLCQGDLLLHFNLVSLGTVPLLQTPHYINSSNGSSAYNGDDNERGSSHADSKTKIKFSLDTFPGQSTSHLSHQLRLSALLEAIKMGRVILLNMVQTLALLCVCFLALGVIPVISQAIPISIPPSIPPSIAILFIFLYIPSLLFTVLLGGGPEAGVMKNTPRKNIFLRKPADERRFIMQLLVRCFTIVTSVFIVGWVCYGSIFKTKNKSWNAAMLTYTVVTDADTDSVYKYWCVQDIMTCELLLSFIIQTVTLLDRGQDYSKLPTIYKHSYVYIICALLIITHVIVIVVRADMRGTALGINALAQLDWVVWVLMFVLPVLQLICAVSLNVHDGYYYQRYLQFLRLEFDTRLGMHSPR